MEQKELKEILSLFAIQGAIGEIKPLGEGLINDTYLVKTLEDECPNYVLQRVNEQVFPDVDMVMRNIEAVTKHIRKKLEAQGQDDIERRVLQFVPLRQDSKLYAVVNGKYWRVMVFIPNAITKQAVNAESSRAAGLAFGQFQSMLADLPVQLGETIKDFHNMEFRLKQLRDVLANDPTGRSSEPRVKEMLAIIDDRAEEMCKAERMGREGILPKRVCHCDTKVNNMMFDDQDNVLCVIDLDTVMPNFIFSDYGDFLRTGANFVAEDDPEIGKVGFREDIFESFTKGYLESAKSFLTPVETENLPYAVALFPYMQCVRFLTDYINGDTYYKIKYPEHNLVRTRNQLALFRCVYAKQEEIARFIASCL